MHSTLNKHTKNTLQGVLLGWNDCLLMCLMSAYTKLFHDKMSVIIFGKILLRRLALILQPLH